MIHSWQLKTISARNTCTLFAILQTADFYTIYQRRFHARIMSQVVFVPKEICATIFIRPIWKISSQSQVLLFADSLKTLDFAMRGISAFTNTLRLFVRILRLVFVSKEKNALTCISKLYLAEIT